MEPEKYNDGIFSFYIHVINILFFNNWFLRKAQNFNGLVGTKRWKLIHLIEYIDADAINREASKLEKTWDFK
jgi:hypothetical protein